ncbi:DUF1294 domain-containing protein [Oleiharenicola lentus]|uniref:DUF1294 domain-containing protein n=1 Tax=Oleiharenicola lentus TaxID=2508720 RepID=UPI003F661084
MKLTPFEIAVLWWVAGTSAWAFILFGWDKWRAGKVGARRVSEAALCWTCALGGWPGGLLGLILFRHKSAKGSFQLKFAAAFFAWMGLLAAGLKFCGRL